MTSLHVLRYVDVQDAICVYGTEEDVTLLAWYLDLDSAGIRLEGPDGF